MPSPQQLFYLSPILPPWLTVLWAALFCLLAGAAFLRQKSLLARRLRWLLLGLRLFPALLLVLWLLQPETQREFPRTNASRLLLMADASASMCRLADCRGENGKPATRWQSAWAIANGIPEGTPSDRWRVGGEALPKAPWPETPDASPLPGETDLAAVLKELKKEAERPGAMPIRSAVLLSDGRDWGKQTLEAAKALSAMNLPVSTLCLGSARPSGNLSVAFAADTPDAVLLQEESHAVLHLRNQFPDPREVTLELLREDGTPVSARDVTIPGNGEADCRMPFPVSDCPGEVLYTAKISTPEDDILAEDNRALHILEYRKPPEFRILFLSADLNWEWRFLRGALASAERLRLSALIRLGLPDAENDALPGEWRPECRFYHLDCEESEHFPKSPEFYSRYDAVILSCATAAALSPEEQQALRGFVERQGGGLLWLGDGNAVPPELHSLLPGALFEERQSGTASKAILAAQGLLFEDILATPVRLPPGSRYTVCRHPGKIARVLLKDDRGMALMLAEGNYGAGRVAWCGLQETWRWSFEKPLRQFHHSFWREIAAWLGENRQPQLEADFPPEGLVAGQDNILALRVLGPDFLPAPAPVLRLTATTGDGISKELPVLPDLQEPGRYLAHFLPEEAGAVRVSFQVRCTPGTAPLTLEKTLRISRAGEELSDVTPNPELLRDIARITGGAVLQTPVDWGALPQSRAIPMTVTRMPWMPGRIVLPVAMLLLLAEYALRRKYGQH